MLCIDSRERHLIRMLAERGVKHEVQTLALGDICIKGGDGEIEAIIERKTWSDLESSQRDGRWREQQERLAGVVGGGVWVGYIIEGKGGESDGRRQGSLLGLRFRWGLGVIETNSLYDTCLLLEYICGKWGDWKRSRGEGRADWEVKKSAIGGVEGYVSMLSVIPGVSSGLGRIIAERWPTMALLVSALQGESGVVELSNLTRGEGGRRVGDVVAKRIKEYLCGAPIEAPKMSVETPKLPLEPPKFLVEPPKFLVEPPKFPVIEPLKFPVVFPNIN